MTKPRTDENKMKQELQTSPSICFVDENGIRRRDTYPGDPEPRLGGYTPKGYQEMKRLRSLGIPNGGKTLTEMRELSKRP